ncbi:MAG: flippase [Chitinophagales bacterium]|jgi:O-antigen/teichoic acid export membrane protein|nr:flippase [Chitinophagales bacterium]
MKNINEEVLDKSEQKDSGDHKELVSGGISAFSTRLIGMGLNWLFALMLARSTGAAGTGIYNLCQSLMNFSNSISKLGSDTLMTRFGAQYKAQRKMGWIKDLYNKSMLVSVPLSLLVSTIIYFFAEEIAGDVFKKPELFPYFRIAALALLPLTVFQISTGGIRGLKKIKQYTFLHNVSNFIFGILILGSIILFTSRRDLYVPVITYVAYITLTSVLSVYWWLKYSNYLSTQSEAGINFREKFWIGISLFVAAFASLIRGYADTFILGRYATIEDVGVYRNAFKVATITRIALIALLIPAAPRFAELFAEGKMDELRKSAQFVTKIIFWCSAPILIIVILGAPFIMGLFGKEFLSGSISLIILAVGQFINAATGPVNSVLIMTGKQKLNRNLMVAATILAVVLDLWLIPRYGAVGAACVNAFGVLLMNAVPFILIKKYYGFYTLDFKDMFNINPRTFLSELKKALKPEKKKKKDNSDTIEDQISNIE